eukprot:4663693-Amphidinium_carterae.1
MSRRTVRDMQCWHISWCDVPVLLKPPSPLVVVELDVGHPMALSSMSSLPAVDVVELVVDELAVLVLISMSRTCLRKD